MGIFVLVFLKTALHHFVIRCCHWSDSIICNGTVLGFPPPPAFLTFYISPAISPHTDALGQFSRCHIQVSKIQIPKLMASFLHLTVPVSIVESSKHNRVAFPFQDSTGEHTWEQFVCNLFTKMNRTNANQRSANVQASIIWTDVSNVLCKTLTPSLMSCVLEGLRVVLTRWISSPHLITFWVVSTSEFCQSKRIWLFAVVCFNLFFIELNSNDKTPLV